MIHFNHAVKPTSMDASTALHCLEARWREYLQERGHFIYKARHGPSIVSSRNNKKSRYIWLLVAEPSSEFKLEKPERAYVLQQMKIARAQREAVYLVVGFMQEPGRVVVVPAAKALKAKHVLSNKGGINWNDRLGFGVKGSK